MGDHQEGPLGRAHPVHALGDDAERVDIEPGVGFVEDRQGGLEDGHLEDLVALFLAAREALVHRPPDEVQVEVEKLRPFLYQAQEVHRVEFGLAAVPPNLVDRRLQEVGVVHPGDLHRVLEGEEDALPGANLGLHLGDVLTAVAEDSRRDVVALAARDHVREGALPGAVRPHHRVDLAHRNLEIEAAQDFAAPDLDAQAADFEEIRHPTAPSRLTPSSFWASTANSMGSSESTSRANPLTIRDTASSGSMPRWRQ